MDKRVLFVCLGNICRSPTAQAVLELLVSQQGLPLSVDSAGTAAYHVGSSPDKRSQQAAKKRGIDMSGLQARAVTADDFYEFDFIFAMDRENLANLKAIQPKNSPIEPKLFLTSYGSVQNLTHEEVPDPYYGGEQGFELVLDLLQEACLKFISVELSCEN